jgi:hypothetical protein
MLLTYVSRVQYLWRCVRQEIPRFWCYIHTKCTIHLCSCVSFLVVAGNSVVVGNSSHNENTF